jgi:hypothetical protein
MPVTFPELLHNGWVIPRSAHTTSCGEHRVVPYAATRRLSSIPSPRDTSICIAPRAAKPCAHKGPRSPRNETEWRGRGLKGVPGSCPALAMPPCRRDLSPRVAARPLHGRTDHPEHSIRTHRPGSPNHVLEANHPLRVVFRNPRADRPAGHPRRTSQACRPPSTVSRCLRSRR